MQIKPYDDACRSHFIQMFTTYFIDDLKHDLPPAIIENRICDFILGQLEKGIVRLDLALLSGRPVGFVLYQIDTPQSDWCKRENWGFIRELYIEKAYRMTGYGKRLAAHAERRLCKMGAKEIYLMPDENARDFWRACGYTEEPSGDCEQRAFSKHVPVFYP